jgi:histo-blood group ABO system transferase
VITQNILKDLNHNIIAVWHDECHVNRYFIDNPPTCILSPSYCYPENWDTPQQKIQLAYPANWKVPFEPKLVALNKNHGSVR